VGESASLPGEGMSSSATALSAAGSPMRPNLAHVRLCSVCSPQILRYRWADPLAFVGAPSIYRASWVEFSRHSADRPPNMYMSIR